MNTYRTNDGDMIDLICYRHYKRRQSTLVEQVLEANYRLSAYGPSLPAGVKISLPDIPEPKGTIKTINLWD